jgi:hypothetical protein
MSDSANDLLHASLDRAERRAKRTNWMRRISGKPAEPYRRSSLVKVEEMANRMPLGWHLAAALFLLAPVAAIIAGIAYAAWCFF